MRHTRRRVLWCSPTYRRRRAFLDASTISTTMANSMSQSPDQRFSGGAWDNRILWSEGTFLQPQHFQQHDRHLDAQLEQRTRALRPHGYGFLEIAVDESLLELGKLALR